MNTGTPFPVAIGLCAFLVGLAGCSFEQPGERIMIREKCFDCHTLAGKGGAVGPNLTRVGSRRTREYIIQQIRNPGAHKADTAMPSFNHLPEQDIHAVADYLSRQK
jgi:cbb3-type cytochrome oxidase cytochrome c subunit